MKTWQIESALVFVTLLITTVLSGANPRDWVALAAVTLTFMHAQIADRMREQDEARVQPAVGCRRWVDHYFMAKETLWITFFLMSGSYTPIVGSVIFFVYPIWRKFYRKSHPM